MSSVAFDLNKSYPHHRVARCGSLPAKRDDLLIYTRSVGW